MHDNDLVSQRTQSSVPDSPSSIDRGDDKSTTETLGERSNGRATILVVEDEPSMREFLQILLRRNKYDTTVAVDGTAAANLITQIDFDLILTDLKMPGLSGLELLKRAKAAHPLTEVVMMTAFASTETAIEAMKVGAYDYLTKPFKVDEVLVTVERALERRKLVHDNRALRRKLSDRYQLESLIGRSKVMQETFEVIRKVATTKANILVTGESGTGKELVARAIHALSARSEGPFVVVNCGAIPESLLESELFGHLKGSFTGAAGDKRGLFEAADGGTIFLDEIGELPVQMQVKLLRTLQEKTIKPVGGVKEMTIDVRILAATNRELEHEVQEGRFRADLYYRLNVIPLRLPPLRERINDIAPLAEHFVEQYAAEMERSVKRISPEAMDVLRAYHYPGNVRELENIIERAVALSTSDTIESTGIPSLSAQHPASDDSLPESGIDLDAHMSRIERQLIVEALERVNGNRTEAAKVLRISLRSLRYRLAKYDLGGTESQG